MGPRLSLLHEVRRPSNMSLFGDKGRERLQEQVIRQDSAITVLEDQVERMADLLADSNDKLGSLLEAHRTLLEAHRDLERELKETREVIPVAPTYRQETLHVPEWEEQAAFDLERGNIDMDMYNEILRNQGLDVNVEIDS
jgi:hypothetical protein